MILFMADILPSVGLVQKVFLIKKSEEQKSGYIISAFLLFGFVFCFIDSFIDYLFYWEQLQFYKNNPGRSIAEAMILKVSPYEMATRIIFVLTCLAAGLIVSKYSIKAEKNKNALVQSEEKCRTLVENIPIGVSMINPKMEILATNRLIKKWFPSTSGGKKEFCYEKFHDSPLAGVCPSCPTWKTLVDGKIHTAVVDLLVGGVMRKFRIISSPVKNHEGKVVSAIKIVDDITDQKSLEGEKRALEVRLAQAQKLEAIGTLAGGIAHDFNNILTAILGYADMVLEELPANSTAWSFQNEVIRAGRRASELVNQILTFSRQADQELEPLQIQPVVKEVLKLLRATIPTSIDIKTDFRADSCHVIANPSQVHQIVMNLCANAYHAMRKKEGVLAIGLSEITVNDDEYWRVMGMGPGKYIKLEITDTGKGMDKEIVDKIFEPYFTTKKKGEGTGLGLSVVHGIVKSHGGG